MINLAIGCPIRDREWIIPEWFDHIHAATRHEGGINAQLFFVGDPINDQGTFRAIDEACLKHGLSRMVLQVPEGELGPYKRTWNLSRFKHMVVLRNRLLAGVRHWAPDYFWSLDSDILVAPEALNALLDTIEDYDAVGGKVFMARNGTCPSYGMLNPLGGLRRPDAEGVFTVDVIMASKLMTPKAYAVDYALHRQGEDIGWSIAARKAGCKLGWDGRLTSKHVMEPADLHKVDRRAGF